MKRSHSNGKRAQIEESISPTLEMITNKVKNKENEIVMNGIVIYIRVQMNYFGENEIIEKYKLIKPNIEQEIIYLESYKRYYYITWNPNTKEVNLKVIPYKGEIMNVEIELNRLMHMDLLSNDYIAFYLMTENEYNDFKGFMILNSSLELLDPRYSASCLIYLDKINQTNKKMIKRLKVENRYKYIIYFMREWKIYKELKKNPHPNICKFYGMKIIEDEIGSIFPSMVLEQGLDFRNVITDLGKILPNKEYYLKVDDYIKQMIEGLRYFHQLGYIHFDVKLENYIVINEQVKLIDFGFSEKKNEMKLDYSKLRKGTSGFVAPEIYYLKPSNIKYIDERIDIWSLGICILIILKKDGLKYELIKRMNKEILELIRSDFYEEALKRMNEIIDEIIIEYENNIEHRKSMKEIIKRMLKVDPKERTKLENIQLID